MATNGWVIDEEEFEDSSPVVKFRVLGPVDQAKPDDVTNQKTALCTISKAELSMLSSNDSDDYKSIFSGVEPKILKYVQSNWGEAITIRASDIRNI